VPAEVKPRHFPNPALLYRATEALLDSSAGRIVPSTGKANAAFCCSLGSHSLCAILDQQYHGMAYKHHPEWPRRTPSRQKSEQRDESVVLTVAEIFHAVD
jgi:hypothetical protein